MGTCVTRRERAALEHLLRQGRTGLWLATRARAVLLAAAGETVAGIARQVGRDRSNPRPPRDGGRPENRRGAERSPAVGEIRERAPAICERSGCSSYPVAALRSLPATAKTRSTTPCLAPYIFSCMLITSVALLGTISSRSPTRSRFSGPILGSM